MITISRSRRAEIKKTAAGIRTRCHHLSAEQTARLIQSALPEVRPLEAWRLALGWPRSRTIAHVAALYRSQGLAVPGLSESMLCRWEHHRNERPGPEYTQALCTVYRATADQLGLEHPTPPGTHACDNPARESMVTMTTAAGLPAVRDSLHLALLADPTGGPTVTELAEAAIEHYALGYSKHPPHTLFTEVHQARRLLTRTLEEPHPPGRDTHQELRRAIGWLSALLGNLAFHLGDHSGARAHLTSAAALGGHTGDARLTTWAHGAQAMVVRDTGDHTLALTHAERGLATAPAGLARAQLTAWALLPSLAALGRHRDADTALADATAHLEADPHGGAPGRFGYDLAEHTLHEAEAHRVLDRPDRAAQAAQRSVDATTPATPGWAAASLLLAQTEAPLHPADAAQRALDVLDKVPAARLRSTARTRLTQLDTALTPHHTTATDELHDRVHALPPAIDAHGNPTE